MAGSHAEGSNGSRADADADVIVIGSGFGGSVAALRLAEKGYSVIVLEAGRRFADDEFAKTSWRLHKYLWAPKLGLYGIQRIHLLKDALILAGAGVGGGSLVYANTLYRPLKPFFDDRQWSHITDWAEELDPYYDQATRMLGVVENPAVTPADTVIRSVAEKMGVGETFHPAPVGVYFNRPGEVDADPYFGGVGPARTGCTGCGACMSGCRVGAKNTLVKNYLYLAERAGVRVEPLTTVSGLKQRQDGSWEVGTERTGAWSGKRRKTTLRADQVVVAAGTWGTQNLLHRMKAAGHLPGISDQLGVLTRTNSEAIVGSGRLTLDKTRDFSAGTAITSSFHPDENTHIEPCRYGVGSNAMGLLQTLSTDGASSDSRWKQALKTALTRPKTLLLNLRHWSQRTMILLVMQSLDNSLTTYLRRSRLGRTVLTSKQGHGQPNPTFIKPGYDANALVAGEIGGIQGSTWNELLEIPMTAHFIGGCAISDTPAKGVVDPYHRVHGCPGLHVVDGSTVSANLGVNPSLTITAQAERALSFWPNTGEPDTRPALGEAYERIAPVRPRSPAVPEAAPAALRLPFIDLRTVRNGRARYVEDGAVSTDTTQGFSTQPG